MIWWPMLATKSAPEVAREGGDSVGGAAAVVAGLAAVAGHGCRGCGEAARGNRVAESIHPVDQGYRPNTVHV